ncbi:MAG: flavin reductase family protein [Roseiflexaceae bacterium]|nr:flavin reductase family protein [Roseiflexaceae bacterium]
MPIDDARFRQVLGRFASGVTVVTTEFEGQFYGMTVSSFSSLSLDPPLILFCVDNQLTTHAALLGAGKFVVNVLEQSQEHLSRRFAKRDIEKFQGVAYQSGALDLPVLDGALAVIECRLYSTAPGGDHTIFIGEVLEMQIGDGLPLLYYRGGYHELK